MSTVSKFRNHDDLRSHLREIIKRAAGAGPVIVGFSGGTDSSLLLWESVQALGPDRVIAVTATSPTSRKEETDEARAFAAGAGVEHLVVESEEFSDPRFIANDELRCYWCKRIRYTMMDGLRVERGGTVIFDGSQADDDPRDRPGMRALSEVGIRTPLSEAGMGKAEVRRLLRCAGFTETAEKPAQPCLATRIPTGVALTREALERVNTAERILRERGLETVRVRDHFPVARIVTDADGIAAIANDPTMRRELARLLREAGYTHVTLDLTEYHG